jgi:hypothetical protein
MIAVMFIVGTSSVLALVPIDRIDPIAPSPQVLAAGFSPFGWASGVADGDDRRTPVHSTHTGECSLRR